MTRPKGHLFLICFLLSGVSAASDLPAQRTTGPAVRIDSGVVEGTYSLDNPKLAYFRGIPYAAPPVGELRWKPPEPASPWHSARKATELSAACPQGDFLYHAIQRTVSTVGGDPSLVQPYGGSAAYLELGAKIEPATGLHQDSFALIQQFYTTRLGSLGP